jgi:hypothetical protein
LKVRFHAALTMLFNDLPATKPARKHFTEVAKKAALAYLGSKRTAHLWQHTSFSPAAEQFSAIWRVLTRSGRHRAHDCSNERTNIRNPHEMPGFLGWRLTGCVACEIANLPPIAE